MKFLKWLLALVGVVGLVAAGVLLGKFALDSRELIGAAQRYSGAIAIQDPFISAMLIAGIAAAGGLVLGIALGMPSRTAGQIRNQALDNASVRREAEIRSRADGGSGQITQG